MTRSTDTCTGRFDARSELRHRRQHGFRTAGVDHDAGITRERRERLLERLSNASARAATTVLRGEHHPATEAFEDGQTVEIEGGACAIEQC